jgi:hypothetical protein
MRARALTINSTNAVRTINKGLCIAQTSTTTKFPEGHFARAGFIAVQMNQ